MIDNTPRTIKTLEELKELAAELVDHAKSLGCRAAIVAVSMDQIDGNDVPTGHSLYGYAHRGPCLDLDGLARRITQATDANWRHSLGVAPGTVITGGNPSK